LCYEKEPNVRLAGTLLPLVLAALVCGCGGKYKTYGVTGRVTLPDGSPVEGVQVVFESADPPVTALGVTDGQGRYELGTVRPGDGAPAGDYRVAVVEPEGTDPENPRPAVIDPRYGSFQTSNLTFTVGPDSREFDIQVEPAGTTDGPPASAAG
jgi:hypothetical protein